MHEPPTPDPSWPRYSRRHFPPYRFVPGQRPHPRNNPDGLSYQPGAPDRALLTPDQWLRSDTYLYGIDLYNFAYWWECHEVFEQLWNTAGHKTEQGNFFQALIQLAAANLKAFMGSRQAARNLLRNGLVRLQRVPESYMGIDVAGLTEDLRQRETGPEFRAPLIRLNVVKPGE